MENESFERALEVQSSKRKRSSILKPPEKRTSRDSRTVSFNDKCIYKELHQDGTCDITNLFLRQDMDLTLMDVVVVNCHNQTINSSMDMSMEQASIVSDQNNSVLSNNNSTLTEDKMIDETLTNEPLPPSPSTVPSQTLNSTIDMSIEPSVIANFYLSLSKDCSMPEVSNSLNDTMYGAFHLSNESIQSRTSAIDRLNDTMYGAFHVSNESVQSRTSAMDSLAINVENLNKCIQKVDEESEECRRKLDEEISELFRFYRHIINKDNKYEFAIRIFGLRYSLWLIIKLNPDTYPAEKLELKFAVNKRDRHLYPFPEYAEAVRRFTKEGSDGYLTRFVINAQRFRRFLRVVGKQKTETNK